MDIPTRILLVNLSGPWKWGTMNTGFLGRGGAAAFYAASRKCLPAGRVHHSKQSYWKETPQFCTLFNLRIKLEKTEGRHERTHSPLWLPKPMLEAPCVNKKKDASFIFWRQKTQRISQKSTTAVIVHSSFSEIWLNLNIKGSKCCKDKQWWIFSLISLCYYLFLYTISYLYSPLCVWDQKKRTIIHDQ